MKTNSRFALMVGAGVALVAAGASAQTYIWNISLDGPSESPPNASPGVGFATITWDTSTQMMSYNVSFSGLTGTTTAAHIHAATAVPGAMTAGVATQLPSFTGFPTGVSSGLFINTFDMNLAFNWNGAYVTANGGTLASAQSALLAAMLSNRAYLNIHTTAFPGGEIRGFIPTPGAAAVLGLGVLAMSRRRR